MELSNKEAQESPQALMKLKGADELMRGYRDWRLPRSPRDIWPSEGAI